MAYADITVNDPNFVKRWLQRKRISDATDVVKASKHENRPHIMDYGAGDGELIRQLAGITSIHAYIFEPSPVMMDEARRNLANVDPVAFIDNLSVIDSGTIDYVFCLEVFEHLPKKETSDALAEINRLLKPGGIVVIGVPHELFLPAVLKGFFRMSRRYGDFDANFSNIFAAIIGAPPRERPKSEIFPGMYYYFHHLGFDYRKLEWKLCDNFIFMKKWFSPFPIFGAVLNSEVYYLLQKA